MLLPFRFMLIDQKSPRAASVCIRVKLSKHVLTACNQSVLVDKTAEVMITTEINQSFGKSN